MRYVTRWRATRFGIATLGLLAATHAVRAQKSVEPTASNFHRVASLDTMQFMGVGASPDGRWLTISAFEGGYPGIWIMPADGHAKPVRLLSAGYSDRFPTWFPKGSRLAFVSNRATRDGSLKSYVMTVAIDPKTGRAVSAPRQISTEDTPIVGAVSFDGKWVAYVSLLDSLWKAVPSTGGTARELVKVKGAGGPMMWSRDGKTVLFAMGSSNFRVPPFGVWYKSSVGGGPATPAYQQRDAMPYYPNTDLHVVLGRRDGAPMGAISRVELYDAKEQLVGATDLPQEMGLFFPRGAPRGFYATTSSTRHENSLLTLGSGSTRALVASRYAWVNGWADNATLVIDGKDSVGSFVATLDTAGHEGRHILLPSDARGMGWGGTVGYATAFRRGAAPAKPMDANPFFIADARTGAIRQLAPDAAGVGTDRDRFIVTVPSGSQLELRGVTTDGRSTLLRSFAKSDNVLKFAARGDLVAWAILSKDSVTVFCARGPNGRPHEVTKVGAASFNGFEFQWSFDGTMLAVTGERTDSSLSVIHIDETGAPRGAPVSVNAHATQLWSMRWTSDNRSLVLTGTPVGAKAEVLMRVPIDAADSPTFYGKNNEWPVVSPDGTRVAYPAVRAMGTTIWRVDFLPPTSTAASKKR